MPQSIILIDAVERHRQIIRQYLNEKHPDVRLVEQEPASYDQVAASVHWPDFDLLLIDNRLGDEDGLSWVERFKSDQHFPPVLFLSSTDSNSSDAQKQAESGMRLGAQGFLFKKQMDMEVLSSYISTILDDTDAAMAINHLLQDQESAKSLSETLPLAPITKGTFHEMQQARALLYGYDNWPFSVQDLQAGNAEFAGYHLERYLGRRDGIYIFAGHSKADSQPYTVKLIDLSQIKSEQPADQLCQAFDDVLGWRHPNIVRWIEYQKLDDYLVIVQDMVEGEKLSHRLRKRGVTEAQAISYFKQILQALSHLHNKEMKAGALSPENILFKSLNELVLVHFNNLRELFQPAEAIAQPNYQQALYFSPEMVQGQAVDYRSDLYIAGVIFYHMLAGVPPYNVGTTQTILTDHVASPTPLLNHGKHPMNEIVLRLMEKTPDKRLQSASTALQMLGRMT